MSEWIITYTGKRVWPLEMRAEDICLEDIAHGLAMTCRFTGHTKHFYSVAQHSCEVERHATLAGVPAGLGLFHDVEEAYLPDVASPIKPKMELLREAGEDIRHLAYFKYCRMDGLQDIIDTMDHLETVKKIDKAVMNWEGHHLVKNWDAYTQPWTVSTLIHGGLTPWPWQEAKEKWLTWAQALVPSELRE